MENKKPDCYGDLEKVFPLNEEGLRETPVECIEKCLLKKECILKAVESDKGLEKKNEMIDSAYESGNLGFFARWSRKKSLHKNRADKKR